MGETQHIALQSTSAFRHAVNGIDENHLLFGNFIGLQYVFERSLEAEVLAPAISRLISEFPALSGRYKAKAQCVSPSDETLSLQVQTSRGSYIDHAEIGGMQTNRNDYIGEPKRRDVLKGKAPLSTFTLTQFKDGGCIFSMAISHVLTDAAGFHSLAARLGDIYTALASKTDLTDANIITHLAAFQFGTDKTKAQTLQTLKHAGSGKPIPLKGMLGLLVKNMIIKTMDQSRNNPPVIIHLTADDLARLKETVLKESGEDWMSTNTALCAHFARIMSQLSHGGNLQTSVQLAQLLDLRGRYFDDPAAEQDQFIGNAILIHIIKQSLPLGLQETPRGELASLFKNWTNTIDTEDVKTRLDMLSDCLRHGYSNPRLDVKVPMIAMNNQSKMAAYNVSFHGQAPVRIRPQDVGDNIMFFPTPLGGVEVYIRDIVNHNNQRKLLTPEWQSRLFDF